MQVKDLKPAGYNPRKISKEKLKALKKSLEEFDDLSGIVFNVRTSTLIGGHQRTKNLDPSWTIVKEPQTDTTGTVAIGYVETPSGRLAYREVDWPESKEKQANITANKLGGEFDNILLKDLIEEIQSSDLLDVELIGFDDEEIEKLMGNDRPSLEYEEKQLRPYSMTHVLISFPPQKIIEIKKHLEEIIKIEGVEYEQSSNG